MLDENIHVKIIDFATAKIKGKIFNKESMQFETEKIDKDDENDQEKSDEDEYFKDTKPKHRATFVGTAEYVSPEMLSGSDNIGFQTDIWAFGCILYYLFYGVSPFKEKSEYLVFQRIRNLDIKFNITNTNIDTISKDLILKLLKINPEERLGSSLFKDLINHDFFDVTYNKKDSNNTDTNTVCPLRYSFETKLDLIKKQNEDKKTREIIILKEAIVEKKSPYLHYNTRKLILYSTPKLQYLEPSKNELKGTIYLSKECRAEYDTDSRFNLITPKKTFIFKINEKDSGVWCKIINEKILESFS